MADEADQLRFQVPVDYVYNPLRYAWKGHQGYVEKSVSGPKRVVFLGMNPGPWGMAQTGVPFGEIPMVRDWIGVETPIDKPAPEHPKRPIEGFACEKSEVSGRRLWGLFRDQFGQAEEFFREYWVANYCPLVFMEASGRNRTPDKLPVAEAQALYQICDQHLQQLVEVLKPEWVIGVGAFAEQRAREALAAGPVKFGRILHPSPASPAANRGWAEAVLPQLRALGLPDFI